MDNMEQAKGKIKQAVGDLTGWEALKRHGEADEKAGNVKRWRQAPPTTVVPGMMAPP